MDQPNLVGTRLSIVGRAPNGPRGQTRWICKCSCGSAKRPIYTTGRLNFGDVKSCGCLRREAAAATARSRTTHGEKRNNDETVEYRTWRSMKNRCTNPAHAQYEDYGGRGIQICERWLKFENFLQDMGRKPGPEYSIDRFPNNNGNYEPGNCRWATSTEQNRNRRSNHLVTYNGETLPIKAWAERFKISHVTLRWRLEQGQVLPHAGRSARR